MNYTSSISEVKKRKQTGFDFKVDKLINSIENVLTGDGFPTIILYFSQSF
jgi:hypothetical protein